MVETELAAKAANDVSDAAEDEFIVSPLCSTACGTK